MPPDFTYSCTFGLEGMGGAYFGAMSLGGALGCGMLLCPPSAAFGEVHANTFSLSLLFLVRGHSPPAGGMNLCCRCYATLSVSPPHSLLLLCVQSQELFAVGGVVVVVSVALDGQCFVDTGLSFKFDKNHHKHSKKSARGERVER